MHDDRGGGAPRSHVSGRERSRTLSTAGTASGGPLGDAPAWVRGRRSRRLAAAPAVGAAVSGAGRARAPHSFRQCCRSCPPPGVCVLRLGLLDCAEFFPSPCAGLPKAHVAAPTYPAPRLATADAEVQAGSGEVGGEVRRALPRRGWPARSGCGGCRLHRGAVAKNALAFCAHRNIA